MHSEDSAGRAGRQSVASMISSHMADDAEIEPEGDTEDAHRIDSEHTCKRGWRAQNSSSSQRASHGTW